MWQTLLIPTTFIKRQTAKAYCLECPSRNNFSRFRYWISKKNAIIKKMGSYEYLELNIFSEWELELFRFTSKRTPPEKQMILGKDLSNLYYLEQDQMRLRLNHVYQPLQADREFEERMRNQTHQRHSFTFDSPIKKALA